MGHYFSSLTALSLNEEYKARGMFFCFVVEHAFVTICPKIILVGHGMNVDIEE